MIPYHRACGPRALGAIARLSEFIVAHELLALQRARGRVTAPGTAPDDMAYWLVSRGYTVEPWNLEADAPESAEHFAEHIRTAPPVSPKHTSVAESMVDQFPTVRRETVEAVVDEWLDDRPKLADWIGGHPIGVFLVQVQEGRRGEASHYLAFRDGRVIAGDDADLRHFGDAAVLRVERISR